MTRTESDTGLWICLVILGWCGALAIHKQLALVRSTSEVVDSPSPSLDKINQATQDAIKVPTLSHLLASTSPDIRDAATKVVAERALQSPAVWHLIRRQLRSRTDVEARDQALTILLQFGPGSDYEHRLGTGPRNVEYDHFFHPATFTAVIACLCNMLPAARLAEERREHHDSREADALWLVHKLIEGNIRVALRAGLVSNWLANYPLNVRQPEKSKKKIIEDMIKNYEYDDDYERLLCVVLFDMTRVPEAGQEMETHGIGNPGYVSGILKCNDGAHWGARHVYGTPAPTTRWWDRGDPSANIHDIPTDVLMEVAAQDHGIFANDLERIPVGEVEVFTEPGPEILNVLAGTVSGRDDMMIRRREESGEERELRSRRREAMVFAEGGGPITRRDIIERRREEEIDEIVEEELEQLIEEVRGEEMGRERRGVRQRTWTQYFMGLRPDGSVRE